MIDNDPIWPISCLYTWFVASVHLLTFKVFPLVVVGRFLSSCFYILAIWKLLKDAPNKYISLLVISNPYVLIYATRAHPYTIGLCCLVFFIQHDFRSKTKFHYLLLTIAVNFQIFFASIVCVVFKNFSIKTAFLERKSFFLYLTSIVLGVLITYLLWGNLLPSKFTSTPFYKENYLPGKLTLGYFPLIYLLTGGYGYFFSNEKITLKSNVFTLSLLIISFVWLCFSGPITGLNQSVQVRFLGETNKYFSLIIYLFLGIGWFRIIKNKHILWMSVLFSSLILSSLPYFYERIAAFAIIAPLLSWIRLNGHINFNNPWLIKLTCFTSLIISVIYNFWGAL